MFVDPSGRTHKRGEMGCVGPMSGKCKVHKGRIGGAPSCKGPYAYQCGGGNGDNGSASHDSTSDTLECNVDIYCDVQTTKFSPIPGRNAAQYIEIEPKLSALGPWGVAFTVISLGVNGYQWGRINLGTEIPWEEASVATMLIYSDYREGPWIVGSRTSLDGLITINNFSEPIEQVIYTFDFDNHDPLHPIAPIKLGSTKVISPNSILLIETGSPHVPSDWDITLTIDMNTANYEGSTVHTINP